MCEKIIKDNKEVGEVTYKLPNKVRSSIPFREMPNSFLALQHYFAVDMAYYGLKNTASKDAEVFMPVDAPSGLIIATVARAPYVPPFLPAPRSPLIVRICSASKL